MVPFPMKDLLKGLLVSFILMLMCSELLPTAEAKFDDLSLFKEYYGCAPCDETQCKNPVGCDLVKEPGLCGCCMICAKQAGSLCGFSSSCGSGLRCNPPENAINGFEALLAGKGVCEPAEVELLFPFERRSFWQRIRKASRYPIKW